VWVEKIVELGEELWDWVIEGMMGYEFLNVVMVLFVDDLVEDVFIELYYELIGDMCWFVDIVVLVKFEVVVNIFELELCCLYEEVEVDNLLFVLVLFYVYCTYICFVEGVIEEVDCEEIGCVNVLEELCCIFFL